MFTAKEKARNTKPGEFHPVHNPHETKEKVNALKTFENTK